MRMFCRKESGYSVLGPEQLPGPQDTDRVMAPGGGGGIPCVHDKCRCPTDLPQVLRWRDVDQMVSRMVMGG